MGFKSEMIKARDEFIALVKAELLGPGSEVSVPDAEHELITTVPEKRYSIGILFPKENKMQADGNDVDRAVPEDEKKDAEQAETVAFDASDYIGKDVTVTEKDKKQRMRPMMIQIRKTIWMRKSAWQPRTCRPLSESRFLSGEIPTVSGYP